MPAGYISAARDERLARRTSGTVRRGLGNRPAHRQVASKPRLRREHCRFPSSAQRSTTGTRRSAPCRSQDVLIRVPQLTWSPPDSGRCQLLCVDTSGEGRTGDGRHVELKKRHHRRTRIRLARRRRRAAALLAVLERRATGHWAPTSSLNPGLITAQTQHRSAATDACAPRACNGCAEGCTTRSG